MIEGWRSVDDIKAHMASPHMAELDRAMAAIQPTGLDVEAYEFAREVALAGRTSSRECVELSVVEHRHGQCNCARTPR